MKSKNSLGRLALLFAMLVLGAPGVGAQGTGGRISGTVLDSSGAVLPGATVTIVQEQTKLTKSTTTDKDGAYLFVSLPVGTRAGVDVLEKALHGTDQGVADALHGPGVGPSRRQASKRTGVVKSRMARKL